MPGVAGTTAGIAISGTLSAYDQFNNLLSTGPNAYASNVTLSAHSAFRTPEASDKLIRMALDIACGL